MIFTAWGVGDREGEQFTFIAGETLPKCERISNPGLKLLKRFEAKSWNDAMKQYHEWQGWEPYKPMLDDKGQEFPEENADLNP